MINGLGGRGSCRAIMPCLSRLSDGLPPFLIRGVREPQSICPKMRKRTCVSTFEPAVSAPSGFLVQLFAPRSVAEQSLFSLRILSNAKARLWEVHTSNIAPRWLMLDYTLREGFSALEEQARWMDEIVRISAPDLKSASS